MAIPKLDPEGCTGRQERLRALLTRLGHDGVVVTGRGYVHSLSGYWHPQPLTPVAMFLPVEGRAVLVLPEGSEAGGVVAEKRYYVAQELATIVEHLGGALGASLLPLLQGLDYLAFAGQPPCSLNEVGKVSDITRAYQYLRRSKDPDELRILEFAIGVTEKLFARAKEMIHQLPTETEIHGALFGLAVTEVGEPLSGWGNDFQSGSPGGLPRDRHPIEGEFAVFDLGVGVRGYRSDLCRSFVVGGEPTGEQTRAHRRVLEVFAMVEPKLRPGVPCADLFEEAHRMLDGWEGFVFTHHLGHGIGLDAHEVPRLNPKWDDVLQEGDVIAVEPALYGTSLRAGLRLEHNYLITSEGARRLSSYPLDFA